MRGLWTAGITDVMMEHNVWPDGLIGVSAGAAFGCNYKSRQIGRAIRYNTRFAKDSRYSGMKSLLLSGDYFHGDVLFSDKAVSFRRILSDHHTETLSGGRLVQWKDHIRCGSHVFPLKGIENMAMVKRNILLFTCGGEYYEIRCGKKSNMRKYLELWKQADLSAESEHR